MEEKNLNNQIKPTVVENDYLLEFLFDKEPRIVDGVRLHQIGKRFCTAGAVVGSHAHINWFELTVVLCGKADIYANGESVTASEGDIFLSFPADIHKIVSDTKEPLQYAFFSFCLEESDYAQEFEKIMQTCYACDKRVFKNQAVSVLIDGIIAEESSNEYKKDEIIACSLKQILLLIIRAFLYTESKHTPNTVTSSELFCHKIIQYIDSNIFTLQNLTEVAEAFHYNYSYIANLFRKTTNTTLAEYLSSQKIKVAKTLIRENKYSFTKIAQLLNYSSIYSFSKSFKFYTGLTPTEYQKKHLKG